MSLLPQKEEYTYEDWLEMDNNENIELIDGVIYMTGEPSRRHQDIVTALLGELYGFLKGKGSQCKVYANPFMVKLNKKNTVHPDVSVVCDKNKLNDRGCFGAPDLIIEILSPSNATHDMWTKRVQYLKAGVKEYWIVDPVLNNVRVNLLDEKQYHEHSYYENDSIQVTVLPGCEIDLNIIFEEEPE